MDYPYFSYDVDAGAGVLDADFSFNTPIVGEAAVLLSGVFLLKSGTLILRKGYKWDFGSGAIDTPAMVAASLAHDGFCDLIASGALHPRYQRAADRFFLTLMKRYGVPLPRRWWCYLAVRAYGSYKRVRAFLVRKYE